LLCGGKLLASCQPAFLLLRLWLLRLACLLLLRLCGPHMHLVLLLIRVDLLAVVDLHCKIEGLIVHFLALYVLLPRRRPALWLSLLLLHHLGLHP